MPVDQALAMIAERITPVPAVEQVGLAQADGASVAADIRSPISAAPFDNSAVDGTQAPCPEKSRLRRGPSWSCAGVWRREARGGLSGAEQAVRVFTGSAVAGPMRLTVFMQQDVRMRRRVSCPRDCAEAPIAPAGEDISRSDAGWLPQGGRRLRPRMWRSRPPSGSR